MSYEYQENDLVSIDMNPIKGTGTIRGIATTEQPVIGAMWIVELTQKSRAALNDYPFSCISVPASSLTPYNPSKEPLTSD